MGKSKILFNPILSKRTFEEVSYEIKRLIFQKILKPGDRLPPESELASQFHVGRQTVREALRILELSGFITVQQGFGGGPIISDTIVNRISHLFLDALQMESVGIEELTVARYKIEKVVLWDVLDSINEEDIHALRKNLMAARERISQGVLATDINLEFHMLLSKASKNQVFDIVVRAILELLRELLSRLPPDLGVSKAAVDAHESILSAIITRRKDEAEALLAGHLEEVKRRIKSLYCV